jgi:hypothetical protein
MQQRYTAQAAQAAQFAERIAEFDAKQAADPAQAAKRKAELGTRQQQSSGQSTDQAISTSKVAAQKQRRDKRKRQCERLEGAKEVQDQEVMRHIAENTKQRQKGSKKAK